jgi:hypothetical protein
MATVTGSTSSQHAQMMRNAWPKLAGGASSMFVYLFDFFTAFPPLAQGLYYLFTGLWPLLSVTTYQAATGHVGDPWHVEMIGVLLLAVGGTLCVAAYRRLGTPEVLFLAFGSAFGLTLVDVHLIYQRVSLVCMIDAIVEISLVVFWVQGWRRARTVAVVASAPAVPTAVLVAPPAPQQR